ncbi:hypothetical protein BJ085DRAFT_15775 [Dimargaris cristalligena]|uniref:Integral membrane protein n=1 Tax=Dimargaris cristalligena TaxID=215637 RepID=A0A4P9ZNZ0_9FUNG|nr:hypothetical protein BJ085DRAFT_15775 [Dimargaris cristalligena]|eukprot:RKP34888.1 hypothetical protein BJ085DRAFT_15775 [Dimargaris cristalligena]
MKTSQTVVLVSGMLVTGTLNTLLTKLQDMECVGNCEDPDPSRRQLFEQPTWQTLNMFAGETLCLIVFYLNIFWTNYRRKRQAGVLAMAGNPDALPATLADTRPLTGLRTLLMWLPAAFDICGTTLMNVGLFYTSASVYQMLRGAVVIFSGIFSVIFLKHRLQSFQWGSLLLIMIGVGTVGMSSVLFPYQPAPVPNAADPIGITVAGVEFSERSLLGVGMVLMAQIFTAAQFVVEEKIMHKFHVVPMRAVGLEGIFGLGTVAMGIPLLHGVIGRTHPGGYFDMYDGFHQIVDNSGVWTTSIAIMFSIAFFNWFGLSVTRSLSATSRSTIDTCRTLFIWMASVSLGWEHFQLLQVAGFAILIYGTFVYNGVVPPPFGKPADTSDEVSE